MELPPRIATLLADQPVGRVCTVRGWVRTRRDAKGGFSFVEINDGSCRANLQVVAGQELANYETVVRRLTTGCCVAVTGTLVASPAKGQPVELQATAVELLGTADPTTYPLQKKRHSFEFLRTMPHLRPRTNSLGAMARVRSRIALAIHRFFAEHGFFWIHTPIITTSDCEGAGEQFTVTALDLEGGNKVDFQEDFFGRRAALTVSGQLEAEAYALALGRVYTFGPTFRAEDSNTSRHLAEFWMVEPEMAFCDLAGDMDLAEAFLQAMAQSALAECGDDLELFERFLSPGLTARLETLAGKPCARLAYDEAITILQQAPVDFAYPVTWGADLQSEHERYLAETVVQGPVIVHDYPKTIKPFYMRVNDDGRTVAAMDLLCPGIGEIIGGSQREERLAILEKRMAELGMNVDDYQWYLDLRRFGSAPHAGFGLGFERLLQLLTGMANIRDTIPFPRTPR